MVEISGVNRLYVWRLKLVWEYQHLITLLLVEQLGYTSTACHVTSAGH